jgi:hypothetical protein
LEEAVIIAVYERDVRGHLGQATRDSETRKAFTDDDDSRYWIRSGHEMRESVRTYFEYFERNVPATPRWTTLRQRP